MHVSDHLELLSRNADLAVYKHLCFDVARSDVPTEVKLWHDPIASLDDLLHSLDLSDLRIATLQLDTFKTARLSELQGI